jgi:transcriptional regulator with XRE-family HTH domain
MSFGSRLRERREALHLKQSELGKLLGVTGSAVGNYENGVSSPKADILYKVFDVLKCDANYLFQDEMENVKSALPANDSALLALFHQLNKEGQEKLLGYADDLVQSEKYIKKYGSAGLDRKAE